MTARAIDLSCTMMIARAICGKFATAAIGGLLALSQGMIGMPGLVLSAAKKPAAG